MEIIYACAGVDFIIGKDGKPYFIEANSSPGGMYEHFLATGSTKIIDALANFILDKVDKPKAIIPINLKRNEKLDPEVEWKVKMLSKFFPTKMVVYNREPEKVKDFNVVLFNRLSFNQEFETDALKINPVEVIRLTIDKHLSTLIAKNAGIKAPESYLVFYPPQARRVIKKSQIREWVLKPNFGGHGRFIKFFEKGEKTPKFQGVHILQERIETKKIDRNFWDVRAFVIGGKYAGGIMRISGSPVVNISQGGTFKAINQKTEKIVEKEAEKVVTAINKVALSMIN